MSRTSHPKFVLTLHALPRHGDQDGMRRLRSLLKALLRGWDMRCTWIEYGTSEGTPDDLDAVEARTVAQERS